LVFIAALCALMAAGVFSVVAITSWSSRRNIRQHPLIAKISKIDTITDADGVSRFVVNGVITNQSEQIYGVPNLIITSRDSDNNIIATQKFLPPATLLDSGQTGTFSYTLSTTIDNIKKVSVELK
jgi:hypothetical protein